MRSKRVILLLSVAILCAVALLLQECRQKSPFELEVEKLMNSRLDVPQDLRDQLVQSNVDVTLPDDKSGLTILTVINGNCGSCIGNLAKWRELMNEEEFSPRNIRYYFLVESEDDFNSFNDIDEQNDLIDYPLIIDHKGTFFKSMNISPNPTFQTFLLDTEDNILMLGNPAHQPAIKELYKKEIKERLNLHGYAQEDLP